MAFAMVSQQLQQGDIDKLQHSNQTKWHYVS